MESRGVQFAEKKSVVFNGRCRVSVSPASKVSVGPDFVCDSGMYNSLDGGYASKIEVGPGASLVIGKQFGMTNSVIYCKNSISIGDYVNVGAGCLIMDSNFHSTDWKMREDRRKDVANAESRPVVIGDYVFIGARSIITKGVCIGDKSIVAAGSVVVKSIPEGEMWGGNPARFIKKIETEQH